MTRFERWAVWSTSVLTTLTGLVYVWMKYLLTPSDPWAVINHPWQPWVLKAHILVAPLLVFAVGSIATRHVWRHLRTNVRVARRTGIATMAVLGPMVASGYLIQVLTDASWLRAMAWGHIATGVVYAVGLAAHRVAAGRRAGGKAGGRTGVTADGSDGGPERRRTGADAGEAEESGGISGGPVGRWRGRRPGRARARSE